MLQISTALAVVLLLTTLNVFIFHSTTTTDEGNDKRRRSASRLEKEIDSNIPEHEVDYTSAYKEIWEDLVSLENDIGTLVQKHKDGGTNYKSDKDATVIGFALGAGLITLKQFVGSLRRTGYNGHIILGLKESDISNTQIKQYLQSQNVVVKVVKFDKCKYPFPKEEYWEINACPVEYPMLKIRWGRFPLSFSWIKECKTCTGPVLFTDTFDVIFQDNPFDSSAPQINELQVFQEHSSKRTTNWLVDYYVNECKGIKFDKPMLCSGTTIGPRDDMLSYLSTMTNEMLQWVKNDKCRYPAVGDDQAIHNYLYYTNKLPATTKSIPHRTGLAIVIGADASTFRNKYINEVMNKKGISEEKANSIGYDGANDNTWISTKYGYTDDKGYFINLDGTRSYIVHQFDRFGPMAGDFYRRRYVD